MKSSLQNNNRGHGLTQERNASASVTGGKEERTVCGFCGGKLRERLFEDLLYSMKQVMSSFAASEGAEI